MEPKHQLQLLQLLQLPLLQFLYAGGVKVEQGGSRVKLVLAQLREQKEVQVESAGCAKQKLKPSILRSARCGSPPVPAKTTPRWGKLWQKTRSSAPHGPAATFGGHFLCTFFLVARSSLAVLAGHAQPQVLALGIRVSCAQLQSAAWTLLKTLKIRRLGVATKQHGVLVIFAKDISRVVIVSSPWVVSKGTLLPDS